MVLMFNSVFWHGQADMLAFLPPAISLIIHKTEAPVRGGVLAVLP